MSCEDYIFYYKKIPNIEEDRQVAGGEVAGAIFCTCDSHFFIDFMHALDYNTR